MVQLRDIFRSAHVFGYSLLAKAFDKGDADLLKAVLDIAWTVLDDGRSVLDDHQVLQVLVQTAPDLFWDHNEHCCHCFLTLQHLQYPLSYTSTRARHIHT